MITFESIQGSYRLFTLDQLPQGVAAEQFQIHMINSYPKIYNLGHAEIVNLFNGTVHVEEKIDGSQFSMSIDSTGELLCRSKGVQINLDDPGMFDKAIATAKSLASDGALVTGWVYRCEYLRSYKHNTIAYGREPLKNLVLFDVELSAGSEIYADRDQKTGIAASLGLDVAPWIDVLISPSIEKVKELTESISKIDSVLGGPLPPEGLVFKNYQAFGADKKILIGKYVRPEFREDNKDKWNAEKRGKTSAAILETLTERFATEARWKKAIQHLRDAGKLEQSMRDIPALMAEIPADIEAECKREIVDALWAHFWPQLRRSATKGLPEFYKDYLAFGDK